MLERTGAFTVLHTSHVRESLLCSNRCLCRLVAFMCLLLGERYPPPPAVPQSVVSDADTASTPGTASLGPSTPGSAGSQAMAGFGSAESSAWAGAGALDAADGDEETESEANGEGGQADEVEALPAKRLEYSPAKVCIINKRHNMGHDVTN